MVFPSVWRRWLIAWLGVLGLAGCTLQPASMPEPTSTRIAVQPGRTTVTPSASPHPGTVPTSGLTHTPRPSPTAIAPSVTLEPTALPIDADTVTRENLLFELVNSERAAQGLPAYLRDPGLDAAARRHSCDMAMTGMLDHTGSDGSTVEQRVPEGSSWNWFSESIAAGSPEPAVIVALWMDEPPDGWHRRNILDADRVAMGAGYCSNEDDPSGNRYYWTMIAAKP